MSEFNGTNPLLDALGDQPTIRDVTINNNTSFKIVEPLTGLQIQTETIVRVHGEVAFQQIQNNIVQLNELQQQEAVTSTAVVVDDQPPASWSLTNCTVADGLLTYTGGLAVEDGNSSGEPLPSLFASKGYELAKVIIELLKMGGETELKKNLLIKKEFKGLQDTIVFDKYGDVIRKFNTFKVVNGKFEIIE